MRAFALTFFLAACALGAQMDVLPIEGKTLRGNPLGDPARRRAAVVAPEGVAKSKPLPLVLYLPGWGGSSEDTIADAKGGWLGQAVDSLAAKGRELRIVAIDARSRYGGSQYLSSTATGNYADYAAVEVLAAVKEKYAVAAGTLVAGHSSGGYGALLLAIRRHETFRAVVALSPDSDFETTHLPLAKEPSVRQVTPDDVAAATAPAGQARMPGGLASLVMGLCANYTPREGKPGQFDWLYDARGQWQPAVWARWIAADPLTVVRQQADAFAPDQRVYLDGAELDEFGANIGAAKIAAVLRERHHPVEFQEPKGHHADQLPERLARGLEWVLAK